MRVALDRFRGEIPKTSKRMLPEGYASIARNVKLLSGELRPLKTDLTVWNPSKTGTLQSLYRYFPLPGQDKQSDVAIVNSSPIQVVWMTNNPQGHGLLTGQFVFITGSGLSIDNQSFMITKIDATTFSLNGTAASGSAFGKAVYQNGYWFTWNSVVDVVRSPVNGDVDHIYYTGDGAPKMTDYFSVFGSGTDYPISSYDLGIPAPTSLITAATGVGGGCQITEQTTTYYVYTYVSTFGEEGPPSPPSTAVQVCPGQTVDLSGMLTGPTTGSYNLASKRIYRVPNGASNYQLVAEVPLASTTFPDTLSDAQLQEGLQTTDWVPPPADMHSLRLLPNGVAVGASQNSVYFSPAFAPYAFPKGWALSTDYPIVGLGTFDTNVVACTEDVPYLITGMDGASMSMAKLDASQACVSKRGITDLDGYGVVYPSPDGLISVSLSGVRNITENYLAREEWQALKPETILGFANEGRYYGFYDNGTKAGFIFDPRDATAGFTHIDLHAQGGYRDPLTDSLYLIDASNNIIRMEGGSAYLTYTYRSRVLRTRETNFAFCRVFADTYTNLTINLYVNGALKHTQAVFNATQFRLPGGYTGNEIEIELVGADPVYSVELGQRIEDFR